MHIFIIKSSYHRIKDDIILENIKVIEEWKILIKQNQRSSVVNFEK